MITGITCGSFDLCHAGHILMFEEAKEYCEKLIVMLQIDPSETPAEYRGKKKNKPIMSLRERAIILSGIKYIDDVVIYSSEEDLYKKLKEIPHHVRILGEDWKDKHATGQEFAKKVVYNERKHNYSTTELRKRIYNEEHKNLSSNPNN